MFYIDLDELAALDQQLPCFSYNRFNLFSFRDRDHLVLADTDQGSKGKFLKANVKSSLSSTKQQITAYLKLHHVDIGEGKIMLLTNLAVLGYNFNPVSFYFCFDDNNDPLCAVAEISNTYHEMKLFFLGKEDLNDNIFQQKVQKYFYVSPFIDLDDFFDFNLTIPDAQLAIKIDDYDKSDKRFFISTLKGTRKLLSTGNMLRYFFSIPMIPLRIMWLIHWQAFKLWIKKINYHPKASNQQLQKDVYKPYKPK